MRLASGEIKKEIVNLSKVPVPTSNSVETVMMICPNLKCRKILRVPGQLRGQHVKCHYCQITFEVPHQKAKDQPNKSAETEQGEK